MNMINKIYQKGKLQHRTKPGEIAKASSGDRLEISSKIEIWKKEMTRLEEADPARRQKIAELSRRIEAGGYEVDPRELAGIILKATKGQQ